MPSFAQFTYLLEHVHSWPIPDLGDLMVEIRRDGELGDEERQALLERLYGVLWQRAQEEMEQAEGGPSVTRDP